MDGPGTVAVASRFISSKVLLIASLGGRPRWGEAIQCDQSAKERMKRHEMHEAALSVTE